MPADVKPVGPPVAKPPVEPPKADPRPPSEFTEKEFAAQLEHIPAADRARALAAWRQKHQLGL